MLRRTVCTSSFLCLRLLAQAPFFVLNEVFRVWHRIIGAAAAAERLSGRRGAALHRAPRGGFFLLVFVSLVVFVVSGRGCFRSLRGFCGRGFFVLALGLAFVVVAGFFFFCLGKTVLDAP